MSAKTFRSRFAASLFCAALILATSAGASGRTTNNLPEEIRAYLAQRLPDWKVVDLSDLLPDDREWWLKKHPNDSPGFVAGRFAPTRAPAYGVTLIPKNPDDRRAKFLIFHNSGRGYTAETMLELPNATPPVVFQGSAGVYKSPDQSRQVRTRYPVIFYVHYEASATIFYWSKGKYRKLQVIE